MRTETADFGCAINPPNITPAKPNTNQPLRIPHASLSVMRVLPTQFCDFGGHKGLPQLAIVAVSPCQRKFADGRLMDGVEADGRGGDECHLAHPLPLRPKSLRPKQTAKQLRQLVQPMVRKRKTDDTKVLVGLNLAPKAANIRRDESWLPLRHE
jgi:hypothetical protein